MNTKIRNRSIAIAGALSALTILFGFTRLGLIPWFSGASITILHVPVILATILAGFGVGESVGLVFGLTSLVVAATQGTGIDLYFVNPVVSVLPRLCIAPAVYFVYKGLRRIKWCPDFIAAAIAAFIGTMVNSALVLLALVGMQAITVEVLVVTITGNSLLEAAAAVIICPAVVAIRNGVKGRRTKSSLTEETEQKE